MIHEFMAEIEKAAQNLKKGLIQDAHADFITHYQDSGLNPAEAKEIANKYVIFYLSQELYLKNQQSLNQLTVK